MKKKQLIKGKPLSFLLLFLLLHTAFYSQNATQTYTAGDTQFSVKNDFTITIDAPYQLSLALEDPADSAYLSLFQIANGYNVSLVSRDTEMSHHINIIGEIKDGAGQLVSTYTKKFTVQQEAPIVSTASWMNGAWGLRYAVSGGVKLDEGVNAGHDYYKGIKQVADTLKTVGYVISNLSHNAHGYHFTLRDHPYIDVANEIHPDFVPSKENEQIIIDALTAIKASGKKVILYLASDGPSATGGTPNNADYKAAWVAYYNKNFAGSEGPALRYLIQGFVERFNDLGLVDGFWVDHAVALPGGVQNFVDMLKSVNPNFAITVNYGKKYFDSTVASNGTGLPANHKVVDLYPTGGSYNDFTAGHPTPLATGAAPNSWGYEELTFEAAKDMPWTTLNNKKIIRHLWAPMRQNWTSTNFPLLFDTEQAYRYVRSLTDAGAALTWANTMTKGAITQEEFEMFKIIDARMQQAQKPDYVPYVRPIGAYFKEENRWIGDPSANNWHDAANWSTGQVPTATSDVVIGVGSVVLVASDANVHNLLIEVGGSLSVSKQINYVISGKLSGTINYEDSIILPPPPEPVAPKIVSQYLFENNPNDEIGDNHGSLAGGVGFSNSVVKEGDYSLSLDGVDDNIDLTAHINKFPIGGSTRTITGWFKANSTTGSIFNYGTEATGQRFQIIGNNSELSIAVSGHKWGSSSLTLSSDWHHFAVVLPDEANVQSDKFLVYLDGVLITSTTLAGSVKAVNTGVTYANIGGGYNGYLDDIRIYSSALNLSEIQAVIKEGSGPVLVSSIAVSGKQGVSHVFENHTLQMEATVLPSDATNADVTWSVADGTGAATIDTNGLLTGVTVGTVTVTAAAKDGSGISNNLVINVQPFVPVTSITVQGKGGATAVELGKSLQMEVVILPENASIKEVVWSIDEEGGNGTIDSNGLFVGNSDEACIVYATATDGSGISGVVSIDIVTVPLVTSIEVQGNNGVSLVEVGSTLQMQSSVLPANADNATVNWSVSNGSGTATINSTGVLTATTVGTVTVIATANDGSGISGQKVITIQESIAEETIYTVADAYVWDKFPTTNYGAIKLIIRNDAADFNRHSFVKFNLASLTAVNTAKFQLTLMADPTSTRTYEAFLVADDSWTETGIKWNNAPAAGVSLGTATNNGKVIEWNITSTVLSEMSGNGILSIKIVSKDLTVHSELYSKEEALINADKPKLVINENGGSLSVNDVAATTAAITVYPNPTSDILYINGLTDTTATISVYNTIGQLLKQEKYNSHIDLSAFKPGVYHLKVLNGSVKKTFSIIKK